MSKSRDNIVNPDDTVENHGADILRVHEMFMGPLKTALLQSTTGPDGAKKWLDRAWRLYTDYGKFIETNNGKLNKVCHATVRKVTDDVEILNLNTVVSQMTIFTNECYKAENIYVEHARGLAKVFARFTPHMGEEIWNTVLGEYGTIVHEPWPTYDEARLVGDAIKVVVQINGKLHGKFTMEAGSGEEAMKKQVLEISAVTAQIEGKTIRRIIVVKGKVVNIVAS